MTTRQMIDHINKELANAKKELAPFEGEKLSLEPAITSAFARGFYTGQIRLVEALITKLQNG